MFGKEAGLTDTEIERIKASPDVASWDPFDATLLCAVDELHADVCIGDAIWVTLAKWYPKKQLMEVVFTVDQYTRSR